jgi:purine-binding chemotaxis protein CheW
MRQLRNSRWLMNKILLFELNTQSLGFDLHYVKEVIENKNIQPVPLAPQFVLGIVNRRGKVFTIVNLAALLGLPSKEPSPDSRIVILEHKEMDIGLLVDKINQTKSVPSPAQAANETRLFNSKGKEFCHMVLKCEEGIHLLDLEKFFTFLKEGKFNG